METERRSYETAADDSDSDPRLGELISRLTENVKGIARDQVELARSDVAAVVKTAARNATAALVSAVIAFVGLGMLCAAAVTGLEPVIDPLWARLLIMAAIYLVVGGALAARFTRKLRDDVSSGLQRTRDETVKTANAVKEALNA